MLQIKNIRKEYRTGDLVQQALDDVSLNLRDNEFVAILGPSGSGKTTLLNIIGGLDRYDSGDLIINGISTQKYKDRDWDSYRNHTIGFVFQSYNLIPHQTVLANVELALTISGIGKEERRKRAIDALSQVGLGQQLHKRPNQMSGGQMQRVAIARALVNDPDILLADEPTGALDSDTSLQVMDLLKEVARDRLVVMVTHNPELAREYATRIVTLKDGKILADSNEFIVDENEIGTPEHKNMGKSSMSFLTALGLSFNNLRTKKARTLLTSFAGSIGIIGIALILALSNGVNAYIQKTEEETLSEYPLQIQSTGFDLTSMMVSNNSAGEGESDEKETKKDEVKIASVVTNMFDTMNSNDLKSLKKYLDSEKCDVDKYTNAVEYSYGISPQIYRQDEDEVYQVHPDTSFALVGLGASGSNSLMSSMMSTNIFFQMPENENLYKDQYEVKAGRWPKNYQECVLVLTSDGSMSDFLLYTLGLRDQLELTDMIKQFANEENISTPEDMGTYTYKDILGKSFKLVNASDYYEYDSQYKLWKDKTDNADYMKKLVANGEDLTIVGIVQPAQGAKAASLTSGINYPASLVTHVVEEAKDSEIVKQQMANPKLDVFTGKEFGEETDNDFDMSSLFKVDESALANAFTMDTDALSGGGGENTASLDLASALNIDSSLVNVEGMGNLLISLTEGYQAYAYEHPEADYSNLQNDFNSYLQSEAATKLIQKHFAELMKNTEGSTITSEQMQDLITSIMNGFLGYMADKPEATPDQYSAYLQKYLQTEEALGIMSSWANKVFTMPEISISNEELTAIARELLDNYQIYVQENNLADITKMGENFANYLQSEDGQYRLSSGLVGAVNTDAIQAGLVNAINAYVEQLMSSLAGAFSIDTNALANAFQFNMTEEDLQELMTSMAGNTGSSYDNNLKNLGYADFDEPSGINLYPKDFDNKEKVVEILDDYNQRMEEAGESDKVISYTDVVGTLMTSVTDIINTISYVLIAFVAISLVVSSIMIGVITYISVLERKKEIGILRAIGASKGNVSQVFNAETFIIGLLAGLLGIGISLLILIPGNMLIHHVAGNTEVNAILPLVPALVLILLSVVLTLIGGLIPSRKAAKSDPVTALRTE